MKMEIIIPTRGRIGKQTTISNLPAELRKHVTLVCPQKEVNSHTLNHPQVTVRAQPDPDALVYKKRRWIMEDAMKRKVEKLVMLDDDLRFCYRRSDDPKKFTTADRDQVIAAFQELEAHLSKDIPHAGFSARGGNISPRGQEGGWQKSKRMMCVLGYHVPTVMNAIDPFRIETREDMDTCLQLLRKGFPNVVNFTFLFDQRFGAPGGASIERNFARANNDARTLEKYHPGLVRVVQKDDAGRPGLSEEARTRLEVVVSWEKAFKEGQQWRIDQASRAKGGTAGVPKSKARAPARRKRVS